MRTCLLSTTSIINVHEEGLVVVCLPDFLKVLQSVITMHCVRPAFPELTPQGPSIVCPLCRCNYVQVVGCSLFHVDGQVANDYSTRVTLVKVMDMN